MSFFLRIVTSILRNVTIHQSFYVLVTTCLRVATNSYGLVTSIYDFRRAGDFMLTAFFFGAMHIDTVSTQPLVTTPFHPQIKKIGHQIKKKHQIKKN